MGKACQHDVFCPDPLEESELRGNKGSTKHVVPLGRWSILLVKACTTISPLEDDGSRPGSHCSRKSFGVC